jgi:hypothetical protein
MGNPGCAALDSHAVITVSVIGLAFLALVGFLLIYLVLKHPHLLFNPSDYAPEVQPNLFPRFREQLIVGHPPIKVVTDVMTVPRLTTEIVPPSGHTDPTNGGA